MVKITSKNHLKNVSKKKWKKGAGGNPTNSGQGGKGWPLTLGWDCKGKPIHYLKSFVWFSRSFQSFKTYELGTQVQKAISIFSNCNLDFGLILVTSGTLQRIATKCHRRLWGLSFGLVTLLSHPKRSWDTFGVPWGALGTLLGCPGALLGAILAIWVAPGASLGPPGEK